jgi:hypothetical protein
VRLGPVEYGDKKSDILEQFEAVFKLNVNYTVLHGLG